MAEFNGFCEEAVNILLDIRFNNNKEWYDSNKDRYKEFVHIPMTNFAEEIYRLILKEHEEFNDRPKVCRIHRDTRFSKNKQRYKDSKWFFLREGNISAIEYPKPNYFFELKAENYIYGLGFWARASHMQLFRDHARNHPGTLEDIMSLYNSQKVFSLTGDVYKKKFLDDMPIGFNDWYLRKEFTFIADRPVDDILFSPDLTGMIASHFLSLYPIYEYFSQIMENVAPPESRYDRG